MDGRVLRLAPFVLAFSGCINFPGRVPDGRHQSTVVDEALWRRPTNFLADRRHDPVLELAQRITSVEDDLRRDGTITVKQPDVWGDANLMEYIQEYEKQMKDRTSKFDESIQAFIANSDNAVFSAESSLAAALGNGATPKPIESSVIKIDSISPFGLLTSAKGASNKGLSLEPTQVARQESVYIDVCQALRRRHLGDDNTRSAGYGLYKVRIPVSILPGRETSEGFAALVTLQAKPVVNATLLRYTFPKLAIADLVDALTPNVRELLLDQRQKMGASLDTTDLLAVDSQLGPSTVKSLRAFSLNKVDGPDAPSAAIPEAKNLVSPLDMQAVMERDNNTREAQSPDLKNFIRKDNLSAIVAYVAYDMQLNHLLGTPKDEDIRPSLFKLFGQVHIVMEQQQIYSHYGSDIHELGRKVLLGCYRDIESASTTWTTEMLQFAQLKPEQCQASWLLALQTGILNQNLKRIAVKLGQEGKLPGADISLLENQNVQFFNLDNGNEAQTSELWRGIIEQEFPLYVFNLDPQFEEQNDIEALSRRRQMQLALAFSVAKQPFNSASKIAASRQLALDEAAIGLNRTVIGFTHGSDTFGWYFRPRLQTPPVESTNIGALARTIWSTGPTESYDLRHRKLEPGIRECEVLIVMPSFVREVNFNVTSNWESLCKPGVTKRSYEEMLVQGRKVHELKACMPRLTNAECYRSGDVERLIERIDQLDAMLGMQTYAVKLPFQYEQSGNGLFGQGRNNLRPRLTSFYGLEFAKADDKELEMSFFLRGANFHPVDTRVICGGKEGSVELLSRELAMVKVKVLIADLANKEHGFEVRLATPDGISNPQYIPLADAVKPAAPSGYQFANVVVVPAEYSGPCCGENSFNFLNNQLAVQLVHQPAPAWPADADRNLLITISGAKADGTPITFGTAAKSKLSVGVFPLVYSEGAWSVEAAKFWEGISNHIMANPPNVGREDFNLTLTGRVAYQAFDVGPTLNSITVQVITCPCPHQKVKPAGAAETKDKETKAKKTEAPLLQSPTAEQVPPPSTSQ